MFPYPGRRSQIAADHTCTTGVCLALYSERSNAEVVGPYNLIEGQSQRCRAQVEDRP